MKREDIEKEFEEIVSRSQHLFKQPVKIEKSSSPLGTYDADIAPPIDTVRGIENFLLPE